MGLSPFLRPGDVMAGFLEEGERAGALHFDVVGMGEDAAG
jgi:hypothetical protein